MTNAAIEIVAKTFALAEDAPTSFEDENWLEGFEAARCMIAVRLSAELERAGLLESASDFLDDCGIPEDEDEGCATCREQIETREFPCDECGKIDADDRPDEIEIPADFPVQPVPNDEAQQRAVDGECIATCEGCGLSWNDSIPTSYTPAPAGRCPFEAFHREQH